MNYLTGIIGDPGSGKTSLMTALLHRAHLRGTNIVANYRLEFPATLMSFSELAALPDSLQHAHIGMDELGEGADSYDFFASGPRKINKLTMQVRKRECLIIYTVQRWGMIAKRLRDLTGGFVLMEDTDRLKPDHTIAACDSLFQATFVDSNMRVTNRVLFDGKPYQTLYNTYEVIWGYDGKELDDDAE